MAKASWCNVSPTTGSSGTTTLTIDGGAHDGRNSRQTTVTVETTAGSPKATKNITVNQAAYGSVLRGDSATLSLTNAANSGYVTGYSNLATLGVAKYSDTNVFTLSDYQFSTNNGSSWSTFTPKTAITGDPGAAAVYKWRFKVTATANGTVNAKTESLVIFDTAVYGTTTPTPTGTGTPAPNSYVFVTVTQAAGAPTLTLSATTINLDAAGTSQTTSVTTNTSFSVS